MTNVECSSRRKDATSPFETPNPQAIHCFGLTKHDHTDGEVGSVMALAATLRPGGFSFNAPGAGLRSGGSRDESTRPFQQEPNYLNLKRVLSRYSYLILLTPESDAVAEDASATRPSELSEVQQNVQAELWSPLPFHRTKWLHNVEGARNLLLQLERAAQAIKVQRTRQTVQRDLAQMRTTIKRLRNRVEEIGREVEAMGEEKWQQSQNTSRETLYDIIQQIESTSTSKNKEHTLQNGKPVADGGEDPPLDTQKTQELFSTSTMRRRDGQATATADDTVLKASGVSTHEKQMHASSADQEALTSSLVSLAAQLKQQSRAFQFGLDQDKSLLNRALEGLDRNISGMEAASNNMQFLKRMSEGEGWLGRMKLYAIIFAMWVVAILLVFVMPKLRF
jgi:hypothetical protein